MTPALTYLRLMIRQFNVACQEPAAEAWNEAAESGGIRTVNLDTNSYRNRIHGRNLNDRTLLRLDCNSVSPL